MNGYKHFPTLIVVILFHFFIISCSGGGSGHKISSESIDDPGASVDALGFQDSYPIELQMQTSSGDFVTVQDGQYVEPGKIRLAALCKETAPALTKFF